MSNSNGDAGVIMAGGVIIVGVMAVSAVMTIVGAIVAAITALISTIVMVLGIVGGVAVLAMAAPPIIRAVGEAKAANLRAVYGTAAQPLEGSPGASNAELEELRRRLKMLELRSAPNRQLER